MARLLIVDGHAYAYRAFHAIRDLRSPSGQPTNAIYGFVKMLTKLRAVIKPTHSVVVWDGGLNAERTAALPAYKAQRPEMPDDLKPQLDEMVGYLKAAGIASICREGVEADDYIAGLARRAADAGLAVVIASSDKDFMQLVSARIGLLNPNDKTETVWTDAQVRAKAGVEPAQVVDWLSLTGDSADNIPGVSGIGPKTAAELLNQFGSVRDLYEQLAKVKSEKLRANLRAAMDTVRRNRELVRLREDLPCEFSPEALTEKPVDAAQLRELYRRWGFKTLLAALAEPTPHDRGAASAAPARESQAVLI
jgi:DNA polymerase-1